MKDIRCLASYALFRELFDSGNNVYTVLSEFIKYLIFEENLHTFDLTDISIGLKKHFYFQIPEAVLKTPLKSLCRDQLINYKKGKYIRYAQLDGANISSLKGRFESVETEQKIIWEELTKYVQEKEKGLFDKCGLINGFCCYMLDEDFGGKYSEYISAFIIENIENTFFMKKLKIIKEGVVLYAGLQFNSHLNDFDSWNTDLTIFLDMEILFFWAGYNGELFKQLFSDFYKLVNEINSASLAKDHVRKIHLKYFEDTKKEIEAYFFKAEDIIKRKISIDPSKTAMSEILKKCNTVADVEEKKTLFFDKLKRQYIFCDEQVDYYEKENQGFNIIDEKCIKQFCNNNEFLENFRNRESKKEITDDDIFKALRFLNRINILRKGISNEGLENIKYIFLTAKKICHILAWSDKLRGENDIPLVTSLDFMTNRFWFKLNKGFGAGEYPVAFNMITKAQMILSSHLNQSISIQYEELKKKCKSGKFSESEAVACLSNLREQARNPEEICSKFDVDEALLAINEGDIEIYVREKTLLKKSLEISKAENEKLEDDLQKQKGELKEINEIVRKKDEKIKEYQSRDEKDTQIIEERQQKNKKIKCVGLRIFIMLVFSGILIIAFVFKVVLGILTLLGALSGAILLKKWYFKLESKILK